MKISKGFEEKWNFPHCLGAIDGKHIVLQAPLNSGSDYFNYKNDHSIVLLAIADADCNIIFADVGCRGRISDGGVFKNTKFWEKLQNNTLNLPKSEPLVGTEVPLPYVFVADDAFPLQEHIMKPFQGNFEKGTIERAYNYRLCRARRVVENLFGIISSTFRVLRKPILLEPKKAETIVLACLYLHNFLRKSASSANTYNYSGFAIATERESNMSVPQMIRFRRIARKTSLNCCNIRNEFANYFFHIGRVEWQDEYE